MFTQERIEQIAHLVHDRGRVLVTDLAGQFGVSEQTIRKDLLRLELEGRVRRTHGGAISRESPRPELGFEIRQRIESAAKQRIGAEAARLVLDGDSIALDASTTALQVARQLRERGAWTQLTVVTNGIAIAEQLAGAAGITILMPGGRVRWEALSVVGPWASNFLRQVNIQHAFVGAAGFTMEAGLTDATEEEAQIKRSFVAHAREVTAVIDHTKWGRTALATFCRIDHVARVVTDSITAMDLAAQLERAGVAVIEASRR